MTTRGGVGRWWRFNVVGAVGIGVQLVALVLLTRAGFAYLPATAMAVETTILHNFAWHEAWTWKDRRAGGWGGLWRRLIQFNATTGAVSLAGNLLGMRILVGWAGLPPAPANLISVCLLGLLNFLVNDRLVFRVADSEPGRRPQGTPEPPADESLVLW